jgi:HPt (histidine-containing phosphotransfer) domain-containing protein
MFLRFTQFTQVLLGEIVRSCGLNEITGFREAGAGQSPALDLDSAIQALGGSEEAFKEVARVFLQYMRESLDTLPRVANSPAQAQALVHELGSSLGAVGALGACSRARDVERRLREGDPDAVAALGALAACVQETVGLLECWLESPPKAAA